jgi:hypothetical protein
VRASAALAPSNDLKKIIAAFDAAQMANLYPEHILF